MTQDTQDVNGVTVLLVDDHEMVRKGLRLLLETVLGCVVTEASGGLHALSLIESSVPDVVLLDARMPEHDGIWTLQEIKQRFPAVPVIILSTYDAQEYVDGAIQHGAAGYLLKDANSEQLRDAISTARDRRGLYLHPQVAQRFVARAASPGGHRELSTREREILALIVKGASTEQIAGEIHVAATTVKTHLTSIYRKLDVANRTQAVAKAIRDDLV